MPIVAQTSANCQHCYPVFWVKCPRSLVHFPWLWQFEQWWCSHWHTTAVIGRYANELEAKSSQNLLDLKNWFLHRWKNYGTIAKRQVIFKWKKGFMTTSIGLIYRCMLLSQPPSRYTVPLNFNMHVFLCIQEYQFLAMTLDPKLYLVKNIWTWLKRSRSDWIRIWIKICKSGITVK
jgi:hypothetical protein